MKAALVRRLLIPISIPALLYCTALEAGAQQQVAQQSAQSHRARILHVYDERTGDPIEGAKVSDMTSGKSSLSSSTGRVGLEFLPDGQNMVSIQKIGYEPRNISVTMAPGDTMPVTLLMRALAPGEVPRLPLVKTIAAAPYISPGMRGFQEREKTRAAGYFIDDTTLRKYGSQELSAVIGPRAPGSKFVYGAHGATYVLSSECNQGAVTVYLDDILLGGDAGPPKTLQNGTIQGTTTPPNLSQFQVSDLGAVEWYPSTDMAPIQYGGTTEGCGVLLLWTRER